MQPIHAFSLDGKFAVITGAASGIGRAAAELFAAAGARVLLADRDPRVDGVATAIGGSAEAVKLDLAENGSPQRLAAIAEERGPVDIWVNVAGVVAMTPVSDPDPANYARIMRINADAVFWCCMAIAPTMRGRKRGTIINVSSNAADKAGPGLSAYAMSKGAVNSLTRVLATELGPDGVRVNALAPGFIVTEMTLPPMDDADRDAYLAFHAARSPMGITGVPEDMANALLYLASDASRFLTGQILRVNGGSTMI